MSFQKIRHRLKKARPHEKKAIPKIHLKLKYPKLLLFIACVILSYLIFTNPFLAKLISNLQYLSYIGIFIAGVLLAFGFSAPFAIGFLFAANPPSIFLATLFGASGAMLMDISIFSLIKHSFIGEFNKLKKTPLFKEIHEIATNSFGVRTSNYLLYVFAGFLILTPIPDEIGIAMLSGLTTIRLPILAVISFVLRSLTIFLILYIAL